MDNGLLVNDFKLVLCGVRYASF